MANSNNILLTKQNSRKRWMLDLCESMFEFYPKKMHKIQDRLKRFETIREGWRSKEDVWIFE